MAGVTKYVIDASSGLAFLLPDEVFKEQAKKLIDNYTKGEVDLIAPPLFFNEIANGLKTAVVRKRVSSSKAKSLLATFLKLEIPISSTESLIPESLNRALKYNISAYDATYVALAQDQNRPLITADSSLFKALKDKISFIELLKDFK